MKIKLLLQRLLEEPFCRAELMRAEIIRTPNYIPAQQPVLKVLAGSLSENYGTFKNWAK